MEEAKQSLGQPTQWIAQSYDDSIKQHPAQRDNGDDNVWPSFGGDEGWAPGMFGGAGTPDQTPWSQQPAPEELYKDYEDFSDEDEDEDEKVNGDDGDDDEW